MTNLVYLLAFNASIASLSEGSIIAIGSNIVILLTLIIKGWWDSKQKKEDRAFLRDLADMTESQLQIMLEAGGEREKKIIEQVRQAKKIAILGVKEAKAAFKEANGVNAKIESLGQKLVEEKTVQKVEVVNTIEHPVPTESVEHHEEA